MLSPRHRFELALGRFKVLSDRLRQLENAHIARGLSAMEAKAAVHMHLDNIDIFALHSAFFAVERNPSTGVVAAFDRELAAFEAAIDRVEKALSEQDGDLRLP